MACMRVKSKFWKTKSRNQEGNQDQISERPKEDLITCKKGKKIKKEKRKKREENHKEDGLKQCTGLTQQTSSSVPIFCSIEVIISCDKDLAAKGPN